MDSVGLGRMGPRGKRTPTIDRKNGRNGRNGMERRVIQPVGRAGRDAVGRRPGAPGLKGRIQSDWAKRRQAWPGKKTQGTQGTQKRRWALGFGLEAEGKSDRVRLGLNGRIRLDSLGWRFRVSPGIGCGKPLNGLPIGKSAIPQVGKPAVRVRQRAIQAVGRAGWRRSTPGFAPSYRLQAGPPGRQIPGFHVFGRSPAPVRLWPGPVAGSTPTAPVPVSGAGRDGRRGATG